MVVFREGVGTLDGENFGSIYLHREKSVSILVRGVSADNMKLASPFDRGSGCKDWFRSL